MKEIILKQGFSALIDDDDFSRFENYKWLWKYNCYSYGIAYYLKKVCKGHYESILMHREIMGLKQHDGLVVDHINHNSLDNQKVNLRVCTQQQNSWNRKVSVKRRFKGVSKVRVNTWLATITHNRKLYRLGFYDSELKAAKAYNIKAQKLFGEYACLNKLD
jgi:hypothetical protein